MTYLQLLYEFVKTGLFSVGGGLAAMPFLYDMADRYPWFDRALLVDMIAVSESTPGPIGINMATYAGYMAGGVWGGVLASLALILPSCVLMAALARALDRFKENRYVQHAFYGLRPAVTALIASAGLGVAALLFAGDAAAFDWRGAVLCVVLLAALRLYKKTQPLYIIAAAGVAGVALGL